MAFMKRLHANNCGLDTGKAPMTILSIRCALEGPITFLVNLTSVLVSSAERSEV